MYITAILRFPKCNNLLIYEKFYVENLSIIFILIYDKKKMLIMILLVFFKYNIK